RQLLGRGHHRGLCLQNRLELRHHGLHRRARRQNHDVGLHLLDARRIALDADADAPLQTRDVADVPAGLRRVEIDAADDFESLALAIRGDITASLGHTFDADTAARGMNYEWMQEFAGQATGLAATFRPTIVGFAAVLDNLSAYADNVQRPSAVVAAAGVYVLAW